MKGRLDGVTEKLSNTPSSQPRNISPSEASNVAIRKGIISGKTSILRICLNPPRQHFLKSAGASRCCLCVRFIYLGAWPQFAGALSVLCIDIHRPWPCNAW
ncbi:hypothetical protein BIW11_12870 [Tropilaelaps mercedesae]|uniref:Uncharacterized protein n=1 Tax=Tropilaelaps mercedesae TaxID=418985 RepID=A0A1V9X4H4_9ACAR|nr:hypothetical protein BIW11_12870 [Tropilaelaps mercedesae]